ncbi:WSC domain-containing protein [Cladochytrium replicatum]|nr:WSC domain-containing protein [Cladochytrium replicatum]
MHLTVFAVALALIAPSAFAAPLIKRDINGYELAGCYSDGTIAYHRALNKASFIDPENMTVDLCTAFCAEKGYTLAGVEYSFECYCGNKIEFGNKAIEAERCSMPCAGEATQICGAGNALSVWSSAGEPVVQNPAPQTEGLPEGCVYVGCHQDSPEERALSFGIGYEGGLTPAVCVEACLAAGYPFSGVEYGQQCYVRSKNKSIVLFSNSFQFYSAVTKSCTALLTRPNATSLAKVTIHTYLLSNGCWNDSLLTVFAFSSAVVTTT